MPLMVRVRVRVRVSESVRVPRVGESDRERQGVKAGLRSIRFVPRVSVAEDFFKRHSETQGTERGAEQGACKGAIMCTAVITCTAGRSAIEDIARQS